jgi:hypothetical protein
LEPEGNIQVCSSCHHEARSAWPGANSQLADKSTEIAPGIHLLALVSDKPGALELRDLSLVINTPDGMVIVSGVRILASTRSW